MEELCILFAHFNDDAVTRHHLDLLRRHNPYPVVPVCYGTDRHVEGAVDVSKFSGAFDSEDRWSSGDAMLYEWYRHARSVEADRYALIEWDTLATQPLRQFYQEVWDADAAASQVKTPKATPYWEWFRAHVPRLPPSLRPHAAGLAPLNAVLISNGALESVCRSEIPQDVFSELRLGTLLNAAGFHLTAFPPENAAMNQFDNRLIVVTNTPGVYHPVKAL